MNKQLAKMEQMVALTLLSYVVGLFFGEALRDVSYGEVKPEEVSYQKLLTLPAMMGKRSKWRCYSGLFVLLKQQPRVSQKVLRQLQRPISQAFACLVLGDVRSFV